jgi:hypothetical protein
VAEALQHLPDKSEALSSNSNTSNKGGKENLTTSLHIQFSEQTIWPQIGWQFFYQRVRRRKC